MHKVDLHYTKEELLIIFDQAYKEDVDHEGHYDCRGGAIHVWSHPWTHAATHYDSVTLGALYINWLEERIDRIETNEGFDLADLLHELAILEEKALGYCKHGIKRFSRALSAHLLPSSGALVSHSPQASPTKRQVIGTDTAPYMQIELKQRQQALGSKLTHSTVCPSFWILLRNA